MKLAQSRYTDVSQGLEDQGSFTVNASATMFYVTMSGIAKDKVGYPVREVCTNAWDAAKGDFDVYLPTRFTPTFRVRDYGSGLSHDQIRNVYTRMFMSTKDGNNEAVGGLGLGCKSPFAYLMKDGAGTAGAGSFNVTSYLDGEARFYVMSIAQDGRPKWQLLATTPTEERNGLEVSFAVRSEDIHRFHDAAERILWSFSPRPRVHNRSFNWDEPVITRQANDWACYDNNSVPLGLGAHVRMGCVSYPVDTQLLGIQTWPWSADCVVFDVPIGSLSVQSSREALSYDDRTIETLKKKIAQFERDYLADTQTELDTYATYLDACNAWFSPNNVNAKLVSPSMRPYLTPRVNYKGRVLVTSLQYHHAQIRANWLRLGGQVSLDVISFDPAKRGQTTTTIPLDRFTTSATARIAYEVRSGRSKEKFQAAVDSGDLAFSHDEPVLWVRAGLPLNVAKLADDLGLPLDSFINLDSYKLPKRIKGPKRPTFMRARALTSTFEVEDEASVDISGGGLYLQIAQRGRRRSSWQFCWGTGPSKGTHWVRDSLNALKSPIGQPILVVNDKQLEKLHAQGSWQPLHAWFMPQLEAMIDFTLPMHIAPTTTRSHVLGYYESRGLRAMAKVPGAPADIVALNALFHKKEDAKTDVHEQLYAIYKAASGERIATTQVDLAKATIDAQAAIEARYPIFMKLAAALGNVSDFQSGDRQTAEHAVHYLNLYLADLLITNRSQAA
jgi:hypothetical protein